MFRYVSVNQWEERRKKAIVRNFQKELKKDQEMFAQTDSSTASQDNTDKTKYMKYLGLNQGKLFASCPTINHIYLHSKQWFQKRLRLLQG